jgi:hypothetical protein
MLIVQVHFRAGALKSHRRQRLQTGPRRRGVEQDAEDSIETAIERLYHLEPDLLIPNRKGIPKSGEF